MLFNTVFSVILFQAREDHIRHVLDEAKANLSRISADSGRYPAILKGLIMQVIFFIASN